MFNISYLIKFGTCDRDKCKIYNQDPIFQDQFFPFDFKGFKTSKLSLFFSKDTKVDSSEINNQGSISRIYNFVDGRSKISFFVKPNDTTDLIKVRCNLIRKCFESGNSFHTTIAIGQTINY